MYSYAAYCPSSAIESWNCYFCTYNSTDTRGFVVVSTFSDSLTGGFGFVGYVGTTVVVSFRGSVDIENWILNIDVVQTSYPGVSGAYVHDGFWTDYSALQSQVRSGVATAVSRSRATSIVVTGHSLGASLATLAALDLHSISSSLNNAAISVYNYGSPRVGNSNFASYYNSKIPNTYRCTNQGDIVPHIIAEDFGYEHTTTEYWWSTKTHYQQCSGGEDSNCSDGVEFWDYSTSEHTDYFGINLDNGC